jgi:hypothetical protein
MFVQQLPWGWVVMNGRERLPPGIGPLSSALIGLGDGRLVWVDGDDVSAWRGRTDVRFAFQSYPTLLTGNGEVPVALRNGAINATHRDARLALGIDSEGRLLIALTRFDVAIPARTAFRSVSRYPRWRRSWAHSGPAGDAARRWNLGATRHRGFCGYNQSVERIA